jgi:hypothetical protein
VSQWTWIDPGAFALVGAGAFMGGVTRLTIALAVIMIEVSSDVHMLLPVLVAIMTVSPFKLGLPAMPRVTQELYAMSTRLCNRCWTPLYQDTA